MDEFVAVGGELAGERFVGRTREEEVAEDLEGEIEKAGPIVEQAEMGMVDMVRTGLTKLEAAIIIRLCGSGFNVGVRNV